MRPIKPGLMPHTVTLYNVFKSPITGKLSFFRTFLRRTRIMHSSSAVNVESLGWTRVVTAGLLVDPKTTQAYRHGTKGVKIQKKFLDVPEWNALDDVKKEQFWTLREGDYVVTSGECQLVPVNAAEFKAVDARQIHSIKPVINKDGSLHHWELSLV